MNLSFPATPMKKTKRQRWPQFAIACGLAILFVNVFSSHDVVKQTIQPNKHFEKNHIAIIGGAGNVGSYLGLHLQSIGHQVEVYDKTLKTGTPPLYYISKHSSSLTTNDLQKFQFVIFLGGCTGRNACASLNPQQRYQANVLDLIDLAKNMNKSQHLITASTSAVSEGRKDAKESDLVFETKLDEYSLSMFQREAKLEELAMNSPDIPHISVLRFGTVVGVSPSQRTDLLFPSLFKAAYTTGVLSVNNGSAMRSFLTLKDMTRAFETLMTTGRSSNDESLLEIWNLASFDASILDVAKQVSATTGSSIQASSSTLSMGFTLNCEKFKKAFKFRFEGTLEKSVSEMNSQIPDSITPKGPHAENKLNDSIPCPVCGSDDLQVVLDLGTQPFANDFQVTRAKAIASPRFPLKLVRCRVCNHYHLSHVASREDLFEHYLYQSGTSLTLGRHFEWLAQKVVKETAVAAGTVLELACNDGSQLNKFKDLGWRTFGVDPAQNLAALAATQNHTVRNGFWPIPFPELPKGDALTAIVAQNVLAHVPSPVDFLGACAAVMGLSTRLYIQTSQCNMQQLGQFDTVYHEHISFFTGHSFLKASELAGLDILSFETTPIHGTSCLVTMKLKNEPYKEPSLSMQERLNKEVSDGIPHEFFGVKYAARADAIRNWITSKIISLHEDQYIVGAYGAAAKGMTLLHYILDADDVVGNKETSLIDWVLDDGHLKQNTYCPGTEIPVLSTKEVKSTDVKRPLAIVVLAWNFLDEILENLSQNLKGVRGEFVVVVPFPFPKVLKVQVENHVVNEVESMLYSPVPLPKLVLHD